MITISVFKNIHYGEALPQMLGEKLNVVPKDCSAHAYREFSCKIKITRRAIRILRLIFDFIFDLIFKVLLLNGTRVYVEQNTAEIYGSSFSQG